MPNIAISQGQGVMGLTAQESLGASEREGLNKLFEPLGKIYWLPEEKFEALGVLAGSGPAFVFVMIEAMVEAGIALGFSAQQAQEMSCQTIQGALALLEKTGQHPGALKWQVTSPKGTTIAGIRALENKGLRSAILETFLATYARATQMH
jgi:pyrroline-5-carboxylate reductase